MDSDHSEGVFALERWLGGFANSILDFSDGLNFEEFMQGTEPFVCYST